MPDFCKAPVTALSLTRDSHLAAATSPNSYTALSLPRTLNAFPAHTPLTQHTIHIPATSLTALSHPCNDVVYHADTRGNLTRTQLDLGAGGVVNGYEEVYSIAAAHGGNEVTDVAAMSGESCVVTAGKEGSIRVWDPVTRQSVAKMEGHRYEVRSLSLASSLEDNVPVTVIASGGRDKTIRLWDVRASSAKCIHTFKGHTGWVHAVALSSSHTPTLISCAGDKTVRVWDLVGMKERAVFRGHEYRVWDVAVARRGRFVVSGSTDATVRAWKVGGADEGECVVFDAHRDSVLCVGVDECIVSGCEDGSAYMWDYNGIFGEVRREDEDVKEGVKEGVLVDVGGCVGANEGCKALDDTPLVVTKSVEHIGRDRDPVSPSPGVEQRRVRAGREESSDTRALKAAVSASAMESPDYDKSAAELVNALRRIRELEGELGETREKMERGEREVDMLRRVVKERDADVERLKKEVETTRGLAHVARVREMLDKDVRKMDVSVEYEDPVNRIGAVSDQLCKLKARLDAMIEAN